MSALWKDNWNQTQAHHEAWWRGEGLVLASWGTGLSKPGAAREKAAVPTEPATAAGWHTDPAYVAARLRADMAAKVWPADMVPLCWPDLGTVSLAPLLGAKSDYGPNNVWYHRSHQFTLPWCRPPASCLICRLC